jgi:hypothetical protein
MYEIAQNIADYISTGQEYYLSNLERLDQNIIQECLVTILILNSRQYLSSFDLDVNRRIQILKRQYCSDPIII